MKPIDYHPRWLLLGALFLFAMAPLWSQDTGKEAYQKAMKAYGKKAYQEAIALYEQALTGDAVQRDSSLFWKASSHFKLRQYPQTLNLLTTLLEEFPDSRWREDAEALQAETLAATGNTPAPEDLGELSPETVMVFLSHMPESQAMPLVQSILNRKGDDRYKEQALFALTQMQGKTANDLLRSYAMNDESPLNSQALQYLAMTQNPENLALLLQKYQSASQPETKKELLSAFMIAGDFKTMLEIARTETHPEVAKQAIVLLGTMGQEAALVQLYKSATDKTRKLAILEGLALGHNSTFLREAIAKETDASVQETMITYLGLAGDCKGIEQVYASAKSTNIKLACVQALLIASSCQSLTHLLEKESDREVRLRLIQNMGIFGDTYLQHLTELYAKSKSTDEKEAILQAFFTGDHAKHLLRIAESETDPQLRKTAIQLLSLTGSDEAVDFLKKKLKPQ